MGAKSATTGAGSKTATRISAVKPKASAKSGKSASDKVVRDSFTMPTKEYAKIAKVKSACLKAGFQIKKSELLRIGVALISAMGPKKLKSAQAKLDPIKTGRPKKQE
jgi:hypothetical protein